jgi:hypothetical protein
MEIVMSSEESAKTQKKKPNVVSLKQILGSEGTKRQLSVRVQLTLKAKFAYQLEELRQMMGGVSYAQAVRNSINLASTLLELSGKEGKLFIEHSDGSRTYIER